MAPLPKRAVIAVTSAKADLFNGKETTGAFISEVLHPFLVFRDAGFEVDLVSETGHYTPDWLSLQPDFLNGSDKDMYEDVNSDFRKKLDHMPRASELDGNDYGMFFASAGHAALIDYPTATGLQKIAELVWANGGVVCAVCHGGALFTGVRDKKSGKSIIAGRTITGFTTEAEDVLHIMSELESWGKPLIEEHAKALGAKYERPKGVWDDMHLVDGRLVTGTNPASARSTAKAAVEVFNTL